MKSRGRKTALTLAVLGLLFGLSTLVLPVWVFQAGSTVPSGIHSRGSETFGIMGTVTTFWNSSTMASLGLHQTAALYAAGEGLLLMGLALGLAGGVLAAWGTGKGDAGRYRATVGLLILLVAGVLLVLMPVLIAVEQPAAFSADTRSSAGSVPSICRAGPSPNTSFWGSCTQNFGNWTGADAWGGGIGWYLSVLGGACFTLSGTLMWRVSKRPERGPRPPKSETTGVNH